MGLTQSYLVLEAVSTYSLRKQVEDHLAEGWELLGAPFATDGPRLFQGMVKRKPEVAHGWG